jgi:murein DD-endopeptidase MepM/ murein hydrolase activator NlpD
MKLTPIGLSARALVLSFSLTFALAFSFTILLPQTLHADTSSHFLWSDTRGFVAAGANCRIRAEDQVPFFISRKPNFQLNAFSKLTRLGFFGGFYSGKLLDRSLITAKDAPDPADGALIRVVSVARNATRPSALHISEAGDKGYLAKESLQDIVNFVIEVTNFPSMLNSTQLQTPLKTQRSFWQATTENEKIITLNCGESTRPVQYVLFDVYILTRMEPIARVGVNIDETKILGSINVYTPDEANLLVRAKEPVQNPPDTPGSGRADTPVPPTKNGKGAVNIPIAEGELEFVICTENKTTAVLDRNLKTKIFSANQFETVIPSQSWDEKRKLTHVEVQFPTRNGMLNSGWIPRSLVQLRSECAPLEKIEPSDENIAVDDSLNTLDKSISRKDCCKFPTLKRSSAPYTGGILQFRAKRNNGRRRHAGCDLYRSKGEPTVAVASGTILRGMYYFYQGVFALEVKHPKFIARYGEVLAKFPKGVAKGKNVVAGQTIGYIGKVNSGCCTPMLHFEMFRGSSHGSLTRRHLPPYDRRSDVMDPTNHLRQWEKAQFGRSI